VTSSMSASAGRMAAQSETRNWERRIDGELCESRWRVYAQSVPNDGVLCLPNNVSCRSRQASTSEMRCQLVGGKLHRLDLVRSCAADIRRPVSRTGAVIVEVAAGIYWIMAGTTTVTRSLGGEVLWHSGIALHGAGS
jgi:hypothetical protein